MGMKGGASNRGEFSNKGADIGRGGVRQAAGSPGIYLGREYHTHYLLFSSFI
jgi:hypothetical protein